MHAIYCLQHFQLQNVYNIHCEAALILVLALKYLDSLYKHNYKIYMYMANPAKSCIP